MITEKQFTRVALVTLTLAVGAIGYKATHAHADGIAAVTPMTYAGSLEEAGVAVTGTRIIRLTVWDDATSTDFGAHGRCVTAPGAVMVTNGRFQMTLDNACTAVVRSTPDLWLDVEIAGASLGRTKISAVPFAVEASRANGLTPAASNLLIPSGSIVAFGGDRVPAGWLLCDGTAVSQAMYPALFTAIGTGHGSGGATGMFNLPDYRGRFLRGVDGAAGRDPDATSRTIANTGGNTGNTVGSVEGSAFANHTHHTGLNVARFNWPPPTATSSNNFVSNFDYGGANTVFTEATDWSTRNAGGSETRPVNAAVNYIIKI